GAREAEMPAFQRPWSPPPPALGKYPQPERRLRRAKLNNKSGNPTVRTPETSGTCTLTFRKNRFLSFNSFGKTALLP
ncbi:unnamed protein product, partial [Rangifer tarandus platyrhynchus]